MAALLQDDNEEEITCYLSQTFWKPALQVLTGQCKSTKLTIRASAHPGIKTTPTLGFPMADLEQPCGRWVMSVLAPWAEAPPQTSGNIQHNVKTHVALKSVICKTQLYAAPNLNTRSNCTQHLVVNFKPPTYPPRRSTMRT